MLGIALAVCLSAIYMRKREVRKLNLALLAILETDTNSRLTTATADGDIAQFVATVNILLERDRQRTFEAARAEANLKRAVTNISHDLRTPLTAAKGYLQMLESPALDEETRAKYLQIVQERLATQTTLMDSLFEFAQVLEGREMPTAEDVNLCNIVRDVLSANYVQLEERGFEVDVDMPDSDIICKGNKDAAERILQNLVRNVYVHGKEYLRIAVADGAIEIANKVENIHEVDTSQLFDRFYTADAARTNKSTGLGLAIVKELATQMGWGVSAKVVGELLVFKILIK